MVRVNLEDIVFNKPMRNTLGLNIPFENTGTRGLLARFKSPNLQRIVEFQHYKDPVKLKKNPDGRYTILNGRHRIAMSFLKGFKTIEARVNK